MSDADIRNLARRAGISVDWIDYSGKQRTVSIDVLRRILAALDLPCDHPDQRTHSRRVIDQTAQTLPPMIAGTQAQSIPISAGANAPA
jgi:4-alpha-glucanotransferase